MEKQISGNGGAENPYAALANPSVLTQPTYEPGKPIEDVAREFGLDPADIIKLASNENASGPSPLAKAAAVRALDDANFYPDGASIELRAKLATHWGLRPSQFLIGNGSNEVMLLLAHALLRPGDEVVFGAEAFIVYKLAALLHGAKPVAVPMPAHTHDLAAMRAAVTARTKLIFLACPNNPTGTINAPAAILDFARSLPPHVVLCLDEAYAEFLDDGAAADIRPLIAAGVKIAGARTFSKIHGLAGLRVGYLYAADELIALVQRARQPFNVNLVAQRAAAAALDDTGFVRRARAVNAEGLRQLETGLRTLGLPFIPGHGNFIVFDIPKDATAAATAAAATVSAAAPDASAATAPCPAKRGALAVFDALQRRGIIVRPLAGYGLPDSLRVTVGLPAQNVRFLETLGSVLRG